MESYRTLLNVDAVLVNVTQRRRRKVVWTDEEVADLLEARCRASPPTYRNIAATLNRNRNRNRLPGAVTDEVLTPQDCINCWHRLFPSAEDANRTMEYLNSLKRVWPRTHIHTEKEGSVDVDGAPKLTAIHVVFPWSKDVMKNLQSSLFCDGTFKVTVYTYQVVAITTLDGNRQHRPLMLSFIMQSTAAQWATIFDIFKRR